MADRDRPTKRLKVDLNPSTSITNTSPGVRSANAVGTSPSSKAEDDVQSISAQPAPSKYRKRGQKPSSVGVGQGRRKDLIRTFSQPSVLCVGDKGIFVTSDKGSEKKALLELHGILQDQLEAKGVDARGQPAFTKVSESITTLAEHDSSKVSAQDGIEADIASELAELRNGAQPDTDVAQSDTAKPMQLITLDMPCVSFVRFPAKSALDPVELVHRICLEAADPQVQQRSRFVKRLTPVSSLAKTLRQGLEKVSEDVLPSHFGPDSAGKITSVKFAIRPSIRENEQLNRDSVIRLVADRVRDLGETTHTVDLKGYEKGVIVEVYRGWVGMSVVDNTNTGDHKQGYEQLKRFNLAEVYAKR